MDSQGPVCSQCQAPLSEPGATLCPPCAGKNPVPPGLPNSTGPTGEGESAGQGGLWPRSWWGFFGILLTPVILAIAFARTKDLVVALAMISSVIASLYCGFWLAFRMAKTPGVRLLVGLVLALGLFGVTITLCIAGCTGAGYQLRL